MDPSVERPGATVMTRITVIRRRLSRELGFVIPLWRGRDNLALGPNSYRITVAGVICAEDEIWPEDLLALDSGDLLDRIPGKAVKDPTFGLDAVWINPAPRRSEERRVGKECVRTCRSRGSPNH